MSTTCRTLYREAIATLYRCNRVVVLPWQNGSGLLDPPAAALEHQELQLDASRFINSHSSLYPAALSRLRTLEIVFPDLGLSGPPSPHEHRQRANLCRDWRAALRCLREQQADGRLAGLTIIVHMGVFTDDIPKCRVGGFSCETYREKFAITRGQFASANSAYKDANMVRGHADLLEPLRELREAGLGKLYVFLESSWHWSPPQGLPPLNFHSRQAELDGAVVAMEQLLERGVMGDDYDSVAQGKMKEYPSQWMLKRRAVFHNRNSRLRGHW